MQQRVYAVVVARNGERFLPRTVDGIQANSGGLAGVVTVDGSSTDSSASLLALLNPSYALSVSAHASFAESVAVALFALEGESISDDDLIWLLHDDSAPEPGALDALTLAFELGPSVGIAGPKVVEWENPRKLVEFGITTTRSGERVQLGAGQLDQAQFDDVTDVLAVGTAGMLVRKSVLSDLAGLDASLSYGDDGLDLCVRARLMGRRVIRVPGARIEHARGQGRSGGRVRERFSRRRYDQRYRRIVYSNGIAAVLRWMGAPLIALLACVGHIFAKQPNLIWGEVWSGLRILASPGQLRRSRRRFRRTRRVALSSIDPLLQTRAETRTTRLLQRELGVARKMGNVSIAAEDDFHYWDTKAPWMIALGAVAAAVLWFPLLGAGAVSGGGLEPLSSFTQLWRHALEPVVDTATGQSAPSDAFALVLALVGSVTFWSPSLAVAWLWFLALPMAGLFGGACVGRIVSSGRAAALGAVVWMFAPPFLAALADGRIAAVIAHLCIPLVAYFVSAALDRRRTLSQVVTAIAAAGLFSAVVVACSPVTLVVLVPAWIVLLIMRPRVAPVAMWLPLPAVALLAPTAVAAWQMGSPLAVFNDPGIPVAIQAPSPLTALAGLPEADALGWVAVAQRLGIPGVWGLAAPILVMLVIAVLGLLSRRWVTAGAGVVVYLGCALLSAVLSGVPVSYSLAEPVTVWTGTIGSMGFLGLAVSMGLAASLPRASGALVTSLGVLLTLAVAAPWAVGAVVSGTRVTAADADEVFPAIVNAQSAADPNARILTVTRIDTANVSVDVQLPSGGRLDGWNTLLHANAPVTDAETEAADLAVRLLTGQTEQDAAETLDSLGIRYVIYRTQDATTASDDIKALNANPSLEKVASTDSGELWAVRDSSSIEAAGGTNQWWWTAVRLAVVVLFVLLAVPTSRPVRSVSRDGMDELPMIGGDEDE
ncbi:MAG TPA: glycosyltransferase [Pseudoclavibacter sp.]|nr:glycosyltransferase [Pseudoclavibacter sp.]